MTTNPKETWMKKIMRAALTAASITGLSLAAAGSVSAEPAPQAPVVETRPHPKMPGCIISAHTSRAASYKAGCGDSNDQIQAQVKCSNTTGGITYRNGPWVSVGVWSEAWCPSGYYRAGQAVLMRG